MRLWTIQTKAAWDDLNKHGTLRATRQHQSKDWPDAYEWITGQLTKRIGPPPHKDAAPLWGWTQYAGEDKKRPDLRRLRHHWSPGVHVMIECDLPDSDVMLSDYDAWHVALNNRYLELTKEELESYLADRQRYDRQPTQEGLDDLRQRYYRSWERIIDMHELTEPDWHPMQNKCIQACFWELKLTDVKSAKQFSAKARQA